MLSDKCSNCGKTASEVRKAWKEVTSRMDRRLEELKKLGFSGVVGI